jgi:hypothetical protein
MIECLCSSGECGGEKPRVLIVSADPAIQSIQDAVHLSGYIFAGVASDAQTALDAIAYSGVDAVLLNNPRFPGWLDLAASLQEQAIPFALLASPHELVEGGERYVH